MKDDLSYIFKLQIKRDDIFFGPGVVQLLLLIDEHKSMLKASKQMKLAYTKALKMVNTAEQNLGFSLLIRKTGGSTGGGSHLTEKAKLVIEYYIEYKKEVDLACNSAFKGFSKRLDKISEQS